MGHSCFCRGYPGQTHHVNKNPLRGNQIMALDINIRITVDTEGTYSDHEASILAALAGSASGHTGVNLAQPATYKAPAEVAEGIRASTEFPAPEPAPAPAVQEGLTHPSGEKAAAEVAKAEKDLRDSINPDRGAAPAEAPKRTRRTKAQIAADKAAEEAEAATPSSSGLGIFEDLDEPSPAEEEAPAEDQPAPAEAPAPAERTLKEALDAATKLLTNGGAAGRAQVMAALEGTKASKVSELAGHDITIFVTALEA